MVISTLVNNKKKNNIIHLLDFDVFGSLATYLNFASNEASVYD
jgi:hypothetical protein